jgi:hypothetical protein
MIKRYLINLYFNGIRRRVQWGPACWNIKGNRMLEWRRRPPCPRDRDAGRGTTCICLLRRLRMTGKLRRDLPAYEEYFKYIDMGGKLRSLQS